MLVCIATVLVGFTEPLTKKEQNLLTAAEIGCKMNYKDSPCLVKFIKKDEYTFNAICGEKRKK